ncbi:MAG TPA: ABC transporter permease [Tepidisphaeraceae bacterium]|nr:ABC transporter permease [Tepidisphaeraceae bacterium]
MSATEVRPVSSEVTEPGMEQPGEADLVIKARKGWIAVDWRELISHRELLVFLIWRDVKVKYKQAILGVAWAIFVPLISVTLFTVIGKAAGFDSKVNGSVTLKTGQTLSGGVGVLPERYTIHLSDGTDQIVAAKDVEGTPTATSVMKKDGTVVTGAVTHDAETWTVKPKTGAATVADKSEVESARLIPYAIFVYAGMLPWLFFQASIVGGGMSLVSQQNLLSKIYMPRLFMPTAVVGSALIDMALSGVVFIGMIAMYMFNKDPNWAFHVSHQVWALVPLLLLTILGGLGLALLLSALTIIFRDMRFLIPFLAQILMWLSGAMYPPRIFGEHENWLAINPIYGVISGYRSAIIGDPWNFFALSLATLEILFLFFFGLFYFKRAERRFADIA